jgi:hypothetical protein
VTGHIHKYMRTFPVYNGQVSTSYVSPPYTVHLTVGGAGCDEMKNGEGAFCVGVRAGGGGGGREDRVCVVRRVLAPAARFARRPLGVCEPTAPPPSSQPIICTLCVSVCVAVPAAVTTDPKWFANGDSTYGMGILSVVNDTLVTWKWFDSDTGAVADSFVLSKAPVA